MAWKDVEKPTIINTDKAPTYGIAIAELKAEGKCPDVPALLAQNLEIHATVR